MDGVEVGVLEGGSRLGAATPGVGMAGGDDGGGVDGRG
jgi:hypothetical protein